MTTKIETKAGNFYAQKRSATRAARAEGLSDEQFRVVEVEGQGFKFELVAEAEAEARLDDAIEYLSEQPDLVPTGEKDIFGGERMVPNAALKAEIEALKEPPAISSEQLNQEAADRLAAQLKAKAEAEEDAHIEEQVEAILQAEDEELAQEKGEVVPFIPMPSAAEMMLPLDVAVQAEEAPKAKPEVSHKSTIESPTKTVWHIADEMMAKDPKTTRKQILDACVAKGIAYYTARTQYQAWKTANKAK